MNIETLLNWININWNLILCSIISFLFGLLMTYLKQRAKNKALLADVKKLTESQEEIKHKYMLDLEKRKYKYESKQAQYIKYFNLIDSFTHDSHAEVVEVIFPLVTKFSSDYLNTTGKKEEQTKVITDFQNTIQNFMFKSHEGLFRVKQETNSIRLISGEKVRFLLNDLELLLDASFDLSNEMISKMTSADFNMIEKLEEVRQVGQRIKITHDELMNEVRKELDEI